MNKKKVALFLTALCATFGLTACSGLTGKESLESTTSEVESSQTSENVESSSVEESSSIVESQATIVLSATSMELDWGETVTLTATVTNTEESVVWTSANSAIAEVSETGVVTAKAEGSTTITATVAGKEATCEITVLAPELSISLNKSTLNLFTQQSFRLVPTTEANEIEVEATYTYESSESAIASVDANGTVRGLSIGSATITVTATYLTYEETVTVPVTVTENVQVNASFDSVELAPEGLEISGKDLSSTATATAEVMINGEVDASVAVVWASADEDVVTVENGVITYVGAGITTVTATYTSSLNNPYTATIEVTCWSELIVKADRNWNIAQGVTGGDKMMIALPQGVDADDITAVKLNGAEKTFEVVDGKFIVDKIGTGAYFCEVGMGTTATYATLVVSESSAIGVGTLKQEKLLWPTVPIGQNGYMSGNPADGWKFYMMNFNANESDIPVEYIDWNYDPAFTTAPYQEGMNVVSFEWTSQSSKLCNEIKLSYNNTEYTFDATLGLWKDAEGNFNTLIYTYDLDGNPVNLADVGTEVWVRTVIVGIETDLVLVNNAAYLAVVEMGLRALNWYAVEEACLDLSREAVIVANINKTAATVLVDETCELYVSTIYVDGAVVEPTITWTSDDETIATVDGGIVTAKAAGETTVKATFEAGGKTIVLSAVITVEKIDAYAYANYDIATGASMNVMPIVLPQGMDPANLAKVELNGTELNYKTENGVFFLDRLAAGIHTLTLTLKDNSTMSVNVKVVDAATSVRLELTNISWNNGADGHAPDGTEHYATANTNAIAGKNPTYSTIPYVEDMNVVTFQMGSKEWNAHLKVAFGYNDTVYYYDEAANCWKDSDGNINKNIFVYDAEGNPVNLATFDADGDSATDLATFVIVGATTAVKLITDTNGYVYNDGEKGQAWFKFNNTSFAWSYVDSSLFASYASQVIGASIVADKTAIELKVGASDTINVTASVYVDGVAQDAPAVAWTTDSDVVTVEDGVITAVSGGTAVVKAYFTFNGVEYSVSINVTSIAATISTDTTELSLAIGENATVDVTAVVYVNGEAQDVELAWTTDSNVVTVEDGVVTAVGVGTAIVTASFTHNEVEYSVTINVTTFSMTANMAWDAWETDSSNKMPVENLPVNAADVTAVTVAGASVEFEVVDEVLYITKTASTGDFEIVLTTATETVTSIIKVVAESGVTADRPMSLSVANATITVRPKQDTSGGYWSATNVNIPLNSEWKKQLLAGASITFTVAADNILEAGDIVYGATIIYNEDGSISVIERAYLYTANQAYTITVAGSTTGELPQGVREVDGVLYLDTRVACHAGGYGANTATFTIANITLVEVEIAPEVTADHAASLTVADDGTIAVRPNRGSSFDGAGHHWSRTTVRIPVSEEMMTALRAGGSIKFTISVSAVAGEGLVTFAKFVSGYETTGEPIGFGDNVQMTEANKAYEMVLAGTTDGTIPQGIIEDNGVYYLHMQVLAHNGLYGADTPTFTISSFTIVEAE